MYYDQTHSVSFQVGSTSKNTWTDWHLVPSSVPIVSEPGVTYKYVDIPGRTGGSLDLTNYLTGHPVQTDRSGSFTFYVDHDEDQDPRPWPVRKQEIADYLNGSETVVILHDDPTHHYVGRCVLKSWTPGDSYSQVTIEYRLRPTRY